MDRKRPINIAVIGAGNIATRHMENLAFLGGNRIAAICDLDELTEDPADRKRIIHDRLRQVHK